MKGSPARWGQSWITNNQGETSSDRKKQGQSYYQLNVTFFLCKASNKSVKVGRSEVFSFIVEKQLGSLFVIGQGYKPR